jgi:hypothetical protein
MSSMVSNDSRLHYSTTPVLQHSKVNPFKQSHWTLTTPIRLDLPLNHSHMEA